MRFSQPAFCPFFGSLFQNFRGIQVPPVCSRHELKTSIESVACETIAERWRRISRRLPIFSINSFYGGERGGKAGVKPGSTSQFGVWARKKTEKLSDTSGRDRPSCIRAGVAAASVDAGQAGLCCVNRRAATRNRNPNRNRNRNRNIRGRPIS